MMTIERLCDHNWFLSIFSICKWSTTFDYVIWCFLYLNWRIITIMWWFYVIHQHELAIGIHVSPPSWILLLLPFPPYPSQLSQSTGFGCLVSYIKLAPSILHMVMYMFQCCSLKSSHPFLLPLNSKVCSLHLCLLCCPARRITGTIFLDSIYMY